MNTTVRKRRWAAPCVPCVSGVDIAKLLPSLLPPFPREWAAPFSLAVDRRRGGRHERSSPVTAHLSRQRPAHGPVVACRSQPLADEESDPVGHGPSDIRLTRPAIPESPPTTTATLRWPLRSRSAGLLGFL